MRFVSSNLLVLSYAGFPVDLLWDLAGNLASQDLNPESWARLNGPTILRVAIEEHDIDAIDSVVFLAGELKSRSMLPAHVLDDFVPLCEYLSADHTAAGPTDHDIFNMMREDGPSDLAGTIAFTPSANLHLLCPNLPLVLKTGILIERVVRYVYHRSMDIHDIVLSSYKPSFRMNDPFHRSLNHLLSMDAIHLLRGGWEVHYEGTTVGGPSISRDWLFKLWRGVLERGLLDTVENDMSPADICNLRAVGRALALALLTRVPIGILVPSTILFNLLIDNPPHLTHPIVFGFQEVVPLELTNGLFSHEELGTIFVGETDLLTAEELGPHIQSLLPVPTRIYMQLIKFLEGSPSRPMKLVRFVTGYVHLPVGGLRMLPLPLYVQVTPYRPDRPYPQAMLCAHTLILPEYPSYALLERYLSEAIEQEDFVLKE